MREIIVEEKNVLIDGLDLYFWYFYPMIKQYIYDFIKYREYSKNIDLELQEKNIKIWIGVLNSLFLIPKLLIVIYLTC